MFRVPYRWMPRTFIANLRSCWLDIYCGVRNLWRWLPVIWFDADFDWMYTARIMEIKLRRLADCMESGYHLHGDRDARQARICAALLKRMMDDNYFENAGYNPNTWENLPDHACQRIVKHSELISMQDQRYLGLLIGKYLRNWWD